MLHSLQVSFKDHEQVLIFSTSRPVHCFSSGSSRFQELFSSLYIFELQFELPIIAVLERFASYAMASLLFFEWWIMMPSSLPCGSCWCHCFRVFLHRWIWHSQDSYAWADHRENVLLGFIPFLTEYWLESSKFSWMPTLERVVQTHLQSLLC